MLVRTTELDDRLAVLDAVFAQRRRWVPPLFAHLVSGDGRAWPAALARVRNARWTAWPREQQVVIRQLLDTAWDTRLATYPAIDDDDPTTILAGLAQLFDDLRPFLDAWVARNDQAGARHLAAFVRTHANEIHRRGHLAGPGWDDRPNQMLQIVTWIVEAHVADALDLAAFSAVERSIREELVLAADQLRSLQPAR